MYNAAAKRLGILRHVSGKVPRKTLEHLYKVLQNKLGWPSLSVRKQYLSCVMCHSIFQGNCPAYLKELAPNSQRHQRVLCNTQDSIFVTYICHTQHFEQPFSHPVPYILIPFRQISETSNIPEYSRESFSCLCFHQNLQDISQIVTVSFKFGPI